MLKIKTLPLLYFFICLMAFPAVYAQTSDDNSANAYDQFWALQKENLNDGHKVELLEKNFETRTEANKAYQDLVKDVVRCTQEPRRVMRLSCYDDTMAELGIVSEAWQVQQKERVATYGFWDVTKEVDNAGDSIFYLKVLPSNPVPGRERTSIMPELVIKCVNEKTTAYVDWKDDLVSRDFTTEPLYVNYIVNDTAQYPGDWSVSPDAKAFFHPDPLTFIDNISKSDILQVEFTSEFDGFNKLVFNTEKFPQAIGYLLENCYSQ